MGEHTPTAPEPCLAGQCRATLACSIWKYCRQRNVDLARYPSLEQQSEWRHIASERARSLPSPEVK